MRRHRITLAFVAFHLSALCALAYAALAQDIVPLPTVVVNYSGLAQLITAIGALVGAITGMLGVILSWSNRAKIEEVRHATNSMKDELVKSVRAEATADGMAQGRAEGVIAADVRTATLAEGAVQGRAEAATKKE